MNATRFLCSSVLETAEKSWSSFHRTYQQNYVEIIKISQNAAFSMWLCLRLFQKLISAEKVSTAHKIDVDLEIVSYIGGSILQKIKKQTARLVPKNEVKEPYSICLQHLVAPNKTNSSHTKLTEIKNRGGLIYPTARMNTIFHKFEITFLKLYGTGACDKIHENTFIGEILKEDVASIFYEILSNTVVNKNVQTSLFKKIARLYFKTRAYNKASKLIERFNAKKQITNKSKSLRKTLKTKSVH